MAASSSRASSPTSAARTVFRIRAQSWPQASRCSSRCSSPRATATRTASRASWRRCVRGARERVGCGCVRVETKAAAEGQPFFCAGGARARARGRGGRARRRRGAPARAWGVRAARGRVARVRGAVWAARGAVARGRPVLPRPHVFAPRAALHPPPRCPAGAPTRPLHTPAPAPRGARAARARAPRSLPHMPYTRALSHTLFAHARTHAPVSPLPPRAPLPRPQVERMLGMQLTHEHLARLRCVMYNATARHADAPSEVVMYNVPAIVSDFYRRVRARVCIARGVSTCGAGGAGRGAGLGRERGAAASARCPRAANKPWRGWPTALRHFSELCARI
jgi:hypothetical protein